MGLVKDNEKVNLFLKRILNYCREYSKSKNRPECGLTNELDFMSKYYRLFGFSELPSKKRRKKEVEVEEKEEEERQEIS